MQSHKRILHLKQCAFYRNARLNKALALSGVTKQKQSG